jgi:hypothetical protein
MIEADYMVHLDTQDKGDFHKTSCMAYLVLGWGPQHFRPREIGRAEVVARNFRPV